LESTDGERLSKCKECKQPGLCINPYHIVIHVKELEVYLVNFINNARKLNNKELKID
jgi:nuclear factor I